MCAWVRTRYNPRLPLGISVVGSTCSNFCSTSCRPKFKPIMLQHTLRPLPRPTAITTSPPPRARRSGGTGGSGSGTAGSSSGPGPDPDSPAPGSIALWILCRRAASLLGRGDLRSGAGRLGGFGARRTTAVQVMILGEAPRSPQKALGSAVAGARRCVLA